MKLFSHLEGKSVELIELKDFKGCIGSVVPL
jgi:hypothetical protein